MRFVKGLLEWIADSWKPLCVTSAILIVYLVNIFVGIYHAYVMYQEENYIVAAGFLFFQVCMFAALIYLIIAAKQMTENGKWGN